MCGLYSWCIIVESTMHDTFLFNTYYIILKVQTNTCTSNSSTFTIVSCSKPTSYWSQYYRIVLNIKRTKHTMFKVAIAYSTCVTWYLPCSNRVRDLKCFCIQKMKFKKKKCSWYLIIKIIYSILKLIRWDQYSNLQYISDLIC